MPTNFGGRIALILIVLLCCLFGFPFIGGGILKAGSLFKSDIPFSQKTNLKPGIDIAGGTSLVYGIKGGDMQTRGAGQTLARPVAAALKKRGDPHGGAGGAEEEQHQLRRGQADD